jgi:RimJ/RimL family protein N-acetyltransferase
MTEERPALRTFDRIEWPVETSRLLLRPIEDRDLPGVFAIRSQPEVSLWLSATATSYDAFAEEWRSSDRFDTVLAVEQDATLVGDVFLRVTDAWSQREVREQALGTQGDIGWLVDPTYAGHGIATEAAAALLALCFETLGLRRVTASAFADNAASLRVMEKLGMRVEGRGVREALHRDLGWVDGVNTALLVEEWRANRIDRP